MDKLWIKAQNIAKEKYENEYGDLWEEADKYEREDLCMTEYENLKEECSMCERDSKTGRFISSKVANNNSNKKENDNMNNSSVNANVTVNNTNKKESGIMMNKEMRMEILKNAGVNTDNFFNVSVNVPIGSSVTITVDGVPYTVNSTNNVVTEVKGENGAVVTDRVVEEIMNKGYVFNRRTDGRWITAQTFKMLNVDSYNRKTKRYESGWDAYLRNHFSYMYQFEMVADELHKLAKMERDNDPEFDRLSRFFTKEVVVELCKQYVRQLKKYVKNAPAHKCKGVPYVKLNRFGNVYLKDLQSKVYQPLENAIVLMRTNKNYNDIETVFNYFKKNICKLPYNTAKCPEWKDAFKGKGAYVTLLNIIKFHGVMVTDFETGEVYGTYDSVVYVENKLNEYKKEYWKFHEMLKQTIRDNNFDLRESIKNNN